MLTVMMISLCSIYTILSLAKIGRPVMQNGNIKTIMAFFLYFNTLNPHPMRLHDLEVFQTKQEEKHEAKQHAESLSSA